MKTLNVILSFSFVLIIISCNTVETTNGIKKETIEITKKDSLVIKELGNLASKSGMFSQEHQKYLDTILHFRPNNARLWQQKAMPCFKSKKYEVGMVFLDKAVALEPENYLDYRAFIKCIFSKQYKESIIDFKKLKAVNRDSHVMDHTYDFYLGLCYLQLNEFENANFFLKNSAKKELESFSEDYISSTDWFYLGISYYELKNYNEAIKNFDLALKQYPTFSDAQYYKYQCLIKLDKLEKAAFLIKEAFNNNLLGNTINEANAIYEKYPYQVYKEELEYLLESTK